MTELEKLKSLLDYESDTGLFKWKMRAVAAREDKIFNSRFAGKTAGTINGHGYVQINVSGRLHKAHRLAWLFAHGSCPSLIDHINRDKTDNRICNLREATKAQNAVNSGATARSKTGVKGVSWSDKENKWIAYIRVDGRSKRIGGFKDISAAASAYRSHSISLHGDFARL
jgi:hypothetical protein